MFAVLKDEFFAIFRLAGQYFRIMLADKAQPSRGFLADDDSPWLFQTAAEQGADAGRACAEYQHGIFGIDFRNPVCPESGGQYIAHEKSLFVAHIVRNPVQPLVGIRHSDIFGLASVDSASQGPASVGVGAVVHEAMPAEEAIPAEGFHIDGDAVSGFDVVYGRPGLFHDADHLMPYGDAGNGSRHAAVLDMQIAGADTAECDPDNRVARVLQFRYRLLNQSEFSFFYIGVGEHGIHVKAVFLILRTGYGFYRICHSMVTVSSMFMSSGVKSADPITLP